MIRRTFLLVSSFLLFTTLAVAGKSVEKKQSDISVNVNLNTGNQEVLSAETEKIEITSTQTATPTPLNPVVVENEIDSEEVNPTVATSNSKIDNYIYPGALILDKTDTSFRATSSDNTTAITDWYENKIKRNGYSVKSFVRTNTNGITKNVISAANGEESLKVEINGNEDSNNSTINGAIY